MKRLTAREIGNTEVPLDRFELLGMEFVQKAQCPSLEIFFQGIRNPMPYLIFEDAPGGTVLFDDLFMNRNVLQFIPDLKLSLHDALKEGVNVSLQSALAAIIKRTARFRITHLENNCWTEVILSFGEIESTGHCYLNRLKHFVIPTP